MANPYKTHWYHRQPQFWLDRDPHRPVGSNATPEVIRLDPVPGHQPSPKPPVRIFLGTEPRQYRGTRVFIWSVMQNRDPARAYEITLMSDLDGIPREGWKTGFTNYRYAIPHLAGNTGRAIYNDVDQIYLADPAEMFDLDMQGKGVLAITEKENSVMLIDCEVMAPLWTLEAVKAGKGHAHSKGVMSENGLYGELPGVWNSRDGEHPVPQIKCLHYTTLHTQPWKPFPEMLRYGENALGYLWHDMEKAADAAGYLMFTADHPSREFSALVALYQQMHETPETFAGHRLGKHVDSVAELVRKTGAETLLDYGAGKGKEYSRIEGEPHDSAWRQVSVWPGVRVRCYDPGHPPFATLPDEQFDGVISTDVVEHLASFDVPWVIDQMFARARRFVFIVAACYPAEKILPDGRNAHTTQQPPYWWHTQMALAARRYPGIEWRLACDEKGTFGKRRTTFDASSPSPLE
ncbi:class I SAM-dependent methyltransferase [Limibaculum sp. FT325]|uniref:class I SAM-dependent methyltransferase n=1 Tax=Thermohalobaculum sediminis TaxID=2939436 RepID=UPI0020C1009D|nr:class I SAM-dependent methyltransferase [Limibaculum sediminis]MCL5775959.1 class I SAM-dependent methyltransferase [Limibaculum sediminis]